MKAVLTILICGTVAACSGVELPGQDEQKVKSEKAGAVADESNTSEQGAVYAMLSDDSDDTVDRRESIANKVLEKFDADQNGALEKAELIEMVGQVKSHRKHMRGKKGKRFPGQRLGKRQPPSFAALLSCLDSNEDSNLSQDEWDAKSAEEKRECLKDYVAE